MRHLPPGCADLRILPQLAWVFLDPLTTGEPTAKARGSSQLARLEVEEQSLAEFVKNAPNLPRYRQMLNIQNATVSTQAVKNILVGGVVLAQLHERQNRQVYESLHFACGCPRRIHDVVTTYSYSDDGTGNSVS